MMNLRTIQQELFEEALLTYFKGANPNLDLSQVIKSLLAGEGTDSILKTYSKQWGRKDFVLLKSLLLAEEFALLLKEQEQTIKLLQSSRVKNLERMFQSSTQNQFLLKLLIKLAKGQHNEVNWKQYYSSIDPSEHQPCQKILNSDEFRMWLQPKQKIIEEKNNNPNDKTHLALEQEAKKSLKQQRLMSVRGDLKKLFCSFSENIETLIDLVISKEPCDKILEKFEDILATNDQYEQLQKILKLPIFSQIKKKVQDLENQPKQDRTKQELNKQFLQTKVVETDIRRKQLFDYFSQFKQQAIPLVDYVLSGKQDKQIIQLSSQILAEAQLTALQSYLSSKQFALLKKRHNISASKNALFEQELATFLNPLPNGLFDLHSFILNGKIKEEGLFISKISTSIPEKQFQEVKKIIFSSPFLKFRKEKLNSFGQISSSASDQCYYQKFSNILNFIYRQCRQYTAELNNIYLLVIRLLKKQSITNILNSLEEDVLNPSAFSAFEEMLNSQQLYKILEGFQQEKDNDKIAINYHFRQLKASENIVKMIFQGNTDSQFLALVAETKKGKPISFIKKIDEILLKESVKNLRTKFVKKRKLSQIFTKDEDNYLINVLSSLQKDKIAESLRQIRQFIGIQRYEKYSYRLFANQVEAITETKLTDSPKISQILQLFHSKKIPVSCFEFISQMLVSNNTTNLLTKYKSQFSETTYAKVQQIIALNEFKVFLQSKKPPNFELVCSQVDNLFDFLKISDQFAHAIVFNSNVQEQIQHILMFQSLQSLDKLHEVLKGKELQKILEKVSLKLPQIEEKVIVQKKNKRHIYKKGTKIKDIKLDVNFNYNDQMFINQKFYELQDDCLLNEHVFCMQGDQYDIEFLSNESTVLLPSKQSVENIKKILQSKLDFTNELCIQIKSISEYVPLQDKSILKKCGTKQLRINYYINLIINVQLRQADENIKAISSQPIAKIQQRIEDQINMKKENQKWYINGQLLHDTTTTTFQKLKIRQNSVRIKIIQDRNLEFYGFDKIISIERNQFKSFYIEDDEQARSIIESSDFPSQAWSGAFRNLCLGFIFSGMKKHSKIKNCLKHIQNIVEKTGKDDKLWKPKTFEEKGYFNETYVIYNIIKSSNTELKTDIFKCLMTHYPIPLVIFNENGQAMKLFEENYWLINKAFTIVSFGLASQKIEDKFEEIHGKSTLLNIAFETDFQDKANLHRVCEGGISIQYNIYQNDEYYVNLIDISNKIEENLIIQLAKASNLLVIHAKRQDQLYVQQWLKQKGINLPVIIFIRDVKNIFNEDKRAERIREKQTNKEKKLIKKYSIVEISKKSLDYFNVQFNQIANSVQEFARQCYQKERKENFWIFSDFLGKSCNKSYLGFNNILKQLDMTSQNLSMITDYFYDWKKLSYKKDIVKQKENIIKMDQIKEMAKKKGIAKILKTILEFYQNNSSRATQIMSKLRIFLTLKRNQLFRDFNQLYKLIQDIPVKQDEQDFKKYKGLIEARLNNINNNPKLTTPKIKELIEQFHKIKEKYNVSKNIDQNWKKIFRDINNQFENYIQTTTFSIENFWREVIYMSKFDPSYSFESNGQSADLHETIVSLSKKQINQSENFEVINGDLLEMPSEFLKKVFENHQHKKIMIVAIFGPQSSGKSTLLNFVLGCDFMSSAGRCTKGIYGTYFEISNKTIPNCEAILVLDTQGLFSNYKNEKFENRNSFDSKLVLFCLQVCDLIIMNTKGDMTKECQQILANAFDSQAIDSKNLPTVYFVLNCNSGPANITQIKQVQNACMEIVKLNPEAYLAVSSTNLKGMSMAFNEITRKTDAAEISKYMATKKIPSDVFYKETNILSDEIFRVLEDRGRQKRGRTLNQAFDDMSLAWATINRFSILTVHGNRKIKKLQQDIEQWIKRQSENLQLVSLQSKKKLSDIQYKKLNQWSKAELNTYKKIIDDMRGSFQVQFPQRTGDNVKSQNRCIERALYDLDSLFDPIVEDLKRSVLERKYSLEMEQSQKNGLDDIITLVKHIKRQQLINKSMISNEEKEERFEKLWSQRISDMREGLNKKKMAGEHYNNMKQLYDSALKASDPTKTIYKIQQPKGIVELIDMEFNQFDKQLIRKVKQKYREQPIFWSSNEKPVMNIEKQTGDLSFKYLDMSKYFEKNIQKVYLNINPHDVLSALSVKYIKKTINQKMKNFNSGSVHVDNLHHDFVHLLGLKVKKARLLQWLNYYLKKKWYNFDILHSPSAITFPKDLQSPPFKIIQMIKRTSKGKQYEERRELFIIEKNKDYFLNKDRNHGQWTKFFKEFRILNFIPDFQDEIARIINNQQCKNSLDGNDFLFNKIFKKILEEIVVCQIASRPQQSKSKAQIQGVISKAIAEDLQKINIKVQNPQTLVTKIFDQQFKGIELTPINISLVQFKSEEDFKNIINDFGPFWDKNILLKSYSKGNINDRLHGVLPFGYIEQSRINVKIAHLSQTILQTYIGKQYQQFLNQIQKSNFKNFINRQLNYQICFEEIQFFIVSKKLEQADINFSIISLKNKVNDILGLINKDLQQVSQRLRFDFIIELHSYAFHLLWLVSLNEEWKNRENLINQFNGKKIQQYQRFLGLSSGKADQENKASSKTFINEYINFLNDKIAKEKRNKAIDLANFYTVKYTRERIQEQVEKRLNEETDEQVIKNYLLKPQEYIEKILQDKVRNRYLIDMEQYSMINYWMIVKQIATLTTEIWKDTLPDVKQCSIQEVFDISILDENKNKAFIELYCQIILKSRKDYVSSQEKLGQFVIKEGGRFKIKNSCTLKENIEFLNIIQTKQIVITNIRLFCEFLKDQLPKIIDNKDLKVDFSQQDKIDAMKCLKIDVCKHKCPLCNKGCDVDMVAHPHHSLHKCNSGHQIRAIGGMIMQQLIQGKVVCTPSILRCTEMNPESKFKFNGIDYKFYEFKSEKSDWDFQVKSQDAKAKKFYEELWDKAGNKICTHYSTAQREIKPIKYSEQTVKQQKASMADIKPAHYIFAIDESGSMQGDRWIRALNSLKDTIQLVSNINKEQNQLISLFKFSNSVKEVFVDLSPNNFNKNVVNFSGGGTMFGPAFAMAIKMMKNHTDKDNIFVFISDGEAEYPDAQIKQIASFSEEQFAKGKSIAYTSILIAESKNTTAPTMERITKELKGNHKLVIDAAQISRLLKEIHFKS